MKQKSCAYLGKIEKEMDKDREKSEKEQKMVKIASTEPTDGI